MRKAKTVGDLLNLLKGLDPQTELWCQDVGDDNECFPIVNLPEITTIAYGYKGSSPMWLVHTEDCPAFEVEDDEEILETKTAVVSKN